MSGTVIGIFVTEYVCTYSSVAPRRNCIFRFIVTRFARAHLRYHTFRRSPLVSSVPNHRSLRCASYFASHPIEVAVVCSLPSVHGHRHTISVFLQRLHTERACARARQKSSQSSLPNLCALLVPPRTNLIHGAGIVVQPAGESSTKEVPFDEFKVK